MSLFDALPNLLIQSKEIHGDFSLFIALEDVHFASNKSHNHVLYENFSAVPLCIDYWVTSPLLEHFDGEPFVFSSKKIATLLGIETSEIVAKASLDETWYSFKIDENKLTSIETLSEVLKELVVAVDPTPVQETETVLFPMGLAGSFDVLLTQREGLLDVRIYNLFGAECGRMQGISSRRTERVSNLVRGISSTRSSSSEFDDSPDVQLDPAVASIIISTLQEMNFDTSTLFPTESFVSYGLDSLELVELEQRLSHKLGVQLPVATLDRDTTMETLTNFVRDLIPTTQEREVDEFAGIPTSQPSKWQKRILLVDSLEPDRKAQFSETVSFNIQNREELKRDRLQEAVSTLIAINPNLRAFYSYDVKLFLSEFLEKGLDLKKSLPISWNLAEDALSLVFHHVTVDGFSLQLLFSQFKKILTGTELQIDQASFEQNDSDEEGEFSPSQPTNKFPSDFPPSSEHSKKARTLRKTFDLTKLMRQLRTNFRCTDYEIFCSSFSLMMRRRWATEMMSIGTAVSVRKEKQMSTVDCLVSVLPVTLNVNGNHTIKEHFGRVAEQLNEVQRNVDSLSTGPVQILLVMDKVGSFEIPGFEMIQTTPAVCKYDQTWYFRKAASRYEIVIEYCSELFLDETMHSMMNDLLRTIRRLSQSSPHTVIQNIDFTNNHLSREKGRVDYPSTAVSNMFQTRDYSSMNWTFGSEVRPQSDIQYTSTVLSRLWEQKYIQHYGDIPAADRQIVLFLPRSMFLGNAVLACWNLGMSIVPISRDWPNQRILDLVTRLHNSLVVTDDSKLTKHLEDTKVLVLNPTVGYSTVSRKLWNRMSKASLGYITCTSGSTGVSKAVCSSIRGLSNLAMNYTRQFFLSSNSRMYQIVNYAFDIFFADLCKSLANGSCLVFAKESLPDWNELSSCSNAYIMPAILSSLPNDTIRKISTLETLQFGGERIHPAALDRLLNTGVSLFQEFGLTEQCVYSSVLRLKKAQNSSFLGQPYENLTLVVKDSFGNVVDYNGTLGELFVDGFTARGYHGMVERNKERFVNGQFATRDQVVSYEKGLKFIGRMDLQVKILGRRIELSEIEAVLCKLSGVEGAVTMVSAERILAFIKPGELKQFALQHLPEYMVPEEIILVENFPLNANGKIDKTKLFIPSAIEPTFKIQPPSTQQEIIICDAMIRILGEPIGANECFFKKGGNSVKAMLVMQVMKERGLHIEVKDFFKARTAEEIARNLSQEEEHDTTVEETKIAKPQEVLYPLSHVQRRLWFVQKLQSDSDAYMYKLKIDFNPEIAEDRISAAMDEIIKHNPYLRAVIIENDGVPFWRITADQSPLLIYSVINSQLRMSLNHLLLDGRSLAILAEQLEKVFSENELEIVNPLLPRGEETDSSYWSQLLDSFEAKAFPPRSAPSFSFTGQVGRVKVLVPAGLIERVCSKLGTTERFPVLLLAVVGTMRRVFDEDDIVIGTTVANRTLYDYGTVGMFANTLPLRFSGKMTIGKVEAQLHNLLLHQNAGLDTIQKLTDMRELIRCVVNYQNISLNNYTFSFGRITIEEHRHAQFPISWIFSDQKKGIDLTLEYDRSLFADHEPRNFSRWFLKSLAQMFRQRSHVLAENKVDVPKATVPSIFYEQTRRTPQSGRFESLEEKLTYEESLGRSLTLSHCIEDCIIRTSGRPPRADDIVAISLEESVSLQLTISSVLLLGCTYTVIPLSFPQEKKEQLLDESRPILVIHDENITFPSWTSFSLTQATRNRRKFILRSHPRDLMYAMFTSGSTGKPKGVPIAYQGAVNMLVHATKLYHIRSEGRILQFTKSHFDASISNIFGSLVNGITLCLLDKDKEAVDAVSSLLPLSVVHMTPMVLDYLWKEPTLQSGIETWSIGGESPSSFSVNGLLFQGQRIVQLYGPTEGTCYQTASVLTLNNPVNCVGTVVYNLPFGLCSWGKEKSLQEDVGQFFCGGEQLSRGYLNDVEKTTLSFVPQLIQSEDDLVLDRNSKVYLSGDRLRRNSQGNLYFLGRKDQQVKVSGSRVEIGEIESAIGRLEGVLSVAVVLQKDQFKKNHLVAFYCGKERDFIFDLATKLAPHMIPLKFVNLDRMPLTSNGKIDKKLLAIRKDVMQKEIAPIRATAIEEKVLSVYRQVLNNQQVQLDDNFFSNGGHSLLAVKLVHHLEKTFDITLPLATVFTEPSPRKMSKFVESSKKVGKEEHRAVSLRPSVLQLPLLRLFRNLSFQNIYTNTVKLRMLKSVSKEKLQKVFKELMRAHLILRTIYRRKAKELTAWTAENVPWNIIRASPEDGLDVFKSFPISIEIEDQSLILKTSHVAVDGHSMKILVQDIEKLLDGKELKGSDKVAEFHQYVQVYFQEHKLLSLEYWRTVLENFSNNPIATDYPNQMPQDYRSVSIKRRISNFSKNIQNLARTNNTSPFSVLIYLVSRAMNGILKRAYSSRMMAFPMNMRSSEHEETVTMGVNTGLVHLTGNENISVVGAKLSESLAHPVLLTDLATVLPNVNKFYEVMVTFDDYSTYKNKYFEVVREPEKYSKCEISIFAGPKSDEIVVDYVSSLFKHETIEALLNDMQLNLRTIIDPEDQFDSFLLTQPQKQMFMASLTGQLRILPFLLRKPSGLSTERLQEIVLLLTQKHEVLRTVFFVSDNGEPRQKVVSLTESYRLIYRDKYKKDSPPKSILLDENVLEVILDKDLLVLWLHHLVTDAWSTRILERDLEELLRIGTKEVHPLKQSIRFNLDRKKTSISNAVLMSVSKADLLFQQVSDKTTFHAKSFTVSKKSSFDFFSRLVLALRNFFKPSTSMNIGLPFANRTSKTSKLVGYFLNNLVINVSKDDTMDDISQKRKQAVIENIPYMELLSAVRDFTRKEEALFQVYINQRYDLESSQPDDKELMSLLPLNCEFALEIDIDSYDQEEKVTVRGQANFISEQIYNKLFDYLKDSLIGVILQQSSLETVLDIVGKLLRKEVKPEDNFFTLGGNSLQAVELAEELEDALETEIEMEIIYAASSLQDIAHKFDGERFELDPKEEPTPARPKNEQIVIEGRTSDVPHYSFSRVLNHLTTSNHPMFVFSDHSTVLYSKVVSSVKKGAYYLKQAYLKLTGRPIRADDILPVIGEKSLETWVDCLTVQCCGAAYLPIRLSEPIHRIREVLGRTKSVCYIGANVHLDLPKLDIHANSRSTDFVLNNGSDLAYVISTSGTTGAPKAVAVQHKGVLNMAMSSVQDLRLTSRDVLNQFTNFSFDNSVLELFSAIAASAELFLDCSPFTPRRFVRQIRTHKLTHCLLFPALVNQFKQDTFESLKYLKYWVTGAEKLSPDLFSRAIGIGLNIVQNYGPTETTCYALTRHMKKGDHSANLGKPIQNTSVWIEGERLFVSGHGIMRGYLNRTDSFVKKKTGIWYATGDIIEANEEKNVLFIGREDSQVKIRGHRVELGEIEERIIELSGVSQCKARWKDRTLTVYCVTELDEAAVRKHCEKILPLHMRPNEVRILEELPLTENSKVDFRRLEKSPRLVAVVEEFLETSVDPKKSLLEVGGTTLVAIHISKKLKQNFSVETLLTKPLETVLPEEYKSTRVSQAWRRVLGDGNFDDKSHFLLSGGTSLHVLKLRQELLKLGMDVSVQQLMNNLELGQMMQLDQPRAVSVLFECNTPKRTVILLHPLYGGAAAYLHLVPLLEEEQTRIVAIEHPNTFGFNTDRLPFFESIDSLAVAYSQQLEEYLCGDMILCGVSIGGTLAAEIARNLLRMPKAVLVVDTLATPNLSKYSFENHRKQLLSDISFVNSAVLANSWDLLNMLNRHQWQIFDFPITLLSVDGTDLGWKRFCTQLTILPISSSHSALLLHPAVDEIAKRIRSFY